MEAMTKEEMREVAKERARIRQRIQDKRRNALREIAGLRPDQCHLAPEIAQKALRVRRDAP